jgi:hypothetical protein
MVSVGLEWSLFNSIPMRLDIFDDGNGTSGESEGSDTHSYSFISLLIRSTGF